MPDRITIMDLCEAKRTGRKIAAVSCYDYTTARLVAQAGVEMILVGDSAVQVVLGYDSTLPATMDFMVAITAAVHRAAPDVYLVADMPFLSYQPSVSEAIKNAGRFMAHAGAHMVKIEATAAQLDTIKAVSDAGIPVMAHIGMRPQSGNLKAQGATAESAVDLIDLAARMTDAGATALLLEGTAREVAKIITQKSQVPVISCGSGPDCDGQILIIHDILGLTPTPGPKFSKAYARLDAAITNAITSYVNEVQSGIFPDDEHSYHVRKSQQERFEKILKTLDI